MKKGLNIIFIVILLALIGTVGFFTFKLFFSEEKITVPDFTDKAQEEVVDWCKSLDKNPCSFEVEYSDTIVKDYVIYQSIAGGQELDKDDSIKFIISQGRKIEIKVPDVVSTTTKANIETWVKANNIPNPIEYINENSDTVGKDIVIRIEPKVVTSEQETIKVFVSIGKKENKQEEKQQDSENENTITVEKGKYINLTESEFKQKATDLGLKANHNEDRDDYSSTVKKGNIVWHGYGEYEPNETFNYGLSLGSEDEEIVIKEDQFVGMSKDEFIKKVKDLGLVPEISEVHEAQYSEYEKDYVIWHGKGTYESGETIHYALSLGKKESESGQEEDGYIVIKQGQYVGKTEDEFKKIALDLGLNPVHKSDRDDYSDTVEKGYIVTHGYASDYVKGEGFNYGLSLGKKSGSDTTKITVNANKYVGSSENDFKSAMTNLKLNAKHDSSKDDYSDTITSGKIVWHNSGSFEEGSNVTYGLSLGKKPEQPVTTKVNVEANKYIGSSESSFKSTITGLGLNPTHDSSKDAFSNTYAEGTIIWHNSGNFDSGANLTYGLSKGVEMVDVLGFEDIASSYEGSSVQETKTNITNYFVNVCGFSNSNISFNEVSSIYAVGKITEININGSSLGFSGKYPKNSTVVISVTSNQTN